MADQATAEMANMKVAEEDPEAAAKKAAKKAAKAAEAAAKKAKLEAKKAKLAEMEAAKKAKEAAGGGEGGKKKKEKKGGVDEEDLIRTNSHGRQYFVSGSAPCRLPPPLEGLMRTLNIEHVNGDWDDDGSAKLKLLVRGFEDATFNKAEPHYAFVTKSLGVQDFVDGYLHHGALCCSEDDAVRALFQKEMDVMSTAAREELRGAQASARRQLESRSLTLD